MIRRSVVSAICPSRPYVVSTKMSFDQLSFDEVSYTQFQEPISNHSWQYAKPDVQMKDQKQHAPPILPSWGHEKTP